MFHKPPIIPLKPQQTAALISVIDRGCMWSSSFAGFMASLAGSLRGACGSLVVLMLMVSPWWLHSFIKDIDNCVWGQKGSEPRADMKIKYLEND